MELRYVTPENAVFAETEGGLLSLRFRDETHVPVYLHSSFPHSNKSSYISVRTEAKQEIGMIRSLDEFPPATVKLLEKHIRLRYFAPIITKVCDIREEFGYSFWDAVTNAGRCRFTVGRGGNVRLVAGNRLLITDVDGNRFIIEDIDRLSEREYRMVEMCM